MRWAVLAVLLSFGVVDVSAQQAGPIPVYAFVQDSTGQVWIVGKTARVAIPIYPATDDQIAGVPWNGMWMIPSPDGISPGTKPTWAGTDPTLASGAATTEVAPAPTAAPTSEDAVSLSGDRAQNSKPFTLKGGRYTATWDVKLRRGQSSCYTSAKILRTSDKRLLETVYSTTLSDRDRQSNASGETQLYGVPAGEYYLDVAETGCSWSVEIKPQ